LTDFSGASGVTANDGALGNAGRNDRAAKFFDAAGGTNGAGESTATVADRALSAANSVVLPSVGTINQRKHTARTT
jgi:hypothetical protein